MTATKILVVLDAIALIWFVASGDLATAAAWAAAAINALGWEDFAAEQNQG